MGQGVVLKSGEGRRLGVLLDTVTFKAAGEDEGYSVVEYGKEGQMGWGDFETRCGRRPMLSRPVFGWQFEANGMPTLPDSARAAVPTTASEQNWVEVPT
jgi:hypothetical protein